MEMKAEALPAIRRGDPLPWDKKLVFGLQHMFTMFGATVLVPILTGLNITVALATAGLGTLLFHLVTKGKVPVYLGSSFAFISVIILVGKEHGGLQYAQGGIIIAGLVYAAMALLVYFAGAKFIARLFPPIVTGPIIMVIGLNLAPVAIDMASKGWGVAIFTLIVVALVNIFFKGFFRMLPVLIGLAAGYILSLILGIVDFSVMEGARWVALPAFTAPKFDWTAISLIAPVAIVTMVEHFGDILAVGATVEDDFVKDPGIHRTLLGDGLATSLAGLLGGPPNTTYSENTGVLALTRVWEPSIMRVAAVFAIALSLIEKLGFLIRTIPTAVIGGISIVLFGMIAAIGIRTVVENRVDMKLSRNLIIASVILVLGIGGAVLDLGGGIKLAGMSLAAISGIILNLILPADR
ncbi:uracil transporter [Clostridiales bacterium PH28_bin88]|nr:uracil transporter [Clostridiales bacterium PH28_bin88]